ncbi:hypothetical protein OH687_15370 [Burkholderia anthina]|nr:hypothetical protein OH687_15370 [Burkholderia anthina]
MPFDVHSLMQDPNHINHVIRFTVKHNVRSSGVAKIPVANDASSPRFFAARSASMVPLRSR